VSELIYEQKIDLPYTYTAGAAQRAALNGLRDGRLVGSRAGDRLAVPARPFAPDGTHLTEFEDAGDEGVLEAVTVAHHIEGAPAFGLIRIDGASWPLLHRLGDGAEQLEPGARVRAVWRDERSGAITDIEHFGPAP
jgi:uncharacterized OB-fold protein